MKKLDYLKQSLKFKKYTKKAWMISAFAVTRIDTSPSAKLLTYDLIPEPWGLSFINEQGDREKIEDSVANTPLFKFSDRLTIDESWCENCKEPTETSIGTFLFNKIALVSCFGTKIPYMAGRVGVEDVEKIVASRLASIPKPNEERQDSFIYVDEYIKFGEALQYLKGLMQLCAYAGTPKGITPPTGIEEYKKQLKEKYGERLNTLVGLAEYEKELMAFDAEYMKDDPTFGKFTKGKIAETSRKKLFLSMGAEGGFGDVKPITNSLDEGWPTDPKEHTALMNGLRWGSYSRGAETVKGGVSAKILLRAANNFQMIDTDCESKLGIRRLYTDKNIKTLFGRTIIEGDKQTHVEKNTEMGNYLNKVLTVRSPMYCKLQGDKICKICAGDNLGRFTTGVTIPLTDVSAILLAASMKAMHTNTLKTAKMNLQTAFS